MSRATVLFLTVWLCVVATAQNRPLIPRLGETIEVSIVNVDVVVTDRNGNHIHGLTRNDFEIHEDGKLQSVSNFAEYSGGQENSTPSTEAPATSHAPRPKRTILVFIDHVAQLSPDKEIFFASLKTLLHETIGPGDVVSVVSWKRMLVTRLPFTQDLTALDRVLAKLEAESASYFPDPDVHARFYNIDVEADRMWRSEAIAIAKAQGVTLSYADIESQSGPDVAKFETIEMRKKLHAIQSLVTGLSGFDGRKVLVLAVNHLALVSGESKEGTGRGSDYDMFGSIEGLGRIAATNNITIYPLFLYGPVKFTASPAVLSAEHPPPRANPDSNETSFATNPFTRSPVDAPKAFAAMVPIARRTGGAVSIGAENFAARVSSIREDLDSYYSLAYRATTSGSGAGHSIVVKMTNPDYVARYRRDYVDKPPVARMQDRVVSSLLQEASGTTIPISVIAGPARRQGRKRWMIPIHVEIPTASLTTIHEKGIGTGAFSVYIAWSGILGDLSEATRQTRTFRIPDAQRGAVRDHFDYDFPLEVDERTKSLVIGVVDEVSQELGIQKVDLPPRS